jgi:hypothetical protein
LRAQSELHWCCARLRLRSASSPAPVLSFPKPSTDVSGGRTTLPASTWGEVTLGLNRVRSGIGAMVSRHERSSAVN